METVSSPFRRSLPITVTSFINKAGMIGLSIIPIILVEQRISTATSAWIMGAIKVAGLLGILISGRLCDRLGLRTTLLLSFVISGLGMLPLPFVQGAVLLALFGALAQFGTSFYYSSARLLVTQLVRRHERAEAIAWQRTANNLAQILSYSLGAFLGRFGTAFLLLFDAATSFAAAGAGAKLLPETGPVETYEPEAKNSRRSTRFGFYHGALIVAVFTGLYEVWMVAAAAKCKILFGTQGLQIFSQLMLLNTILCGVLSVLAARHLRRALVVLPAGMFLLAAGLIVTFGPFAHKSYFFAGALLMTFGELVFNSMSGLVLIHITPPGKNQAAMYSNGVLLQFTGRILGASLAFPLVVDVPNPLPLLITLSVLALALTFSAKKILQKV